MPRRTASRSLLESHPALAQEASGWNPKEIGAGSGKNLLWRCNKGHEWSARVFVRVRGSTCPVCSGRKALVGFNDLSTTHRNLAREAIGWNPSLFTSKSAKKMTWKCSQGHQWIAAIYLRAQGGGCPYCSGNKVAKGFNDLATTHPVIAAQADGWDPTTVSSGSNRKSDWFCEQGHRWTSTPKARAQGDGCPVCSGNQVVPGLNDLATLFPRIASEARGWDTRNLTSGSSRTVDWTCEAGHAYRATVKSRVRGTGCPFCSGRRVLPGFNDLATTHPAIAAQAHGWDPTSVSGGSNKKLSWKCERGHVWDATVFTRSSRSGCPVCSGHKVLPGFNDLATTHPAIAAQAHGWDPTSVSGGSNKKLSWKCERGHVWDTTVFTRSNGSGCPFCSGKRVLPGFNDLATTHPAIAAQAHGWDPTSVSGGSNKRLLWKCNQGHIWKTMVFTRTDGSGCPTCSGNRVEVGVNDFLSTHPQLALEADGWNPMAISRGSNQKLPWRCSKGHQWKATVSDRTAGYGCPTCSEPGFDPAKPGWLYLIENDAERLLQIGISNSPERRLKDHGSRGWVPLDIQGPMEGEAARDMESKSLRILKALNAQFANEINLEPFSGYTESWLKSSYPLKSLKEILDLVHEMENKELKSIKPS